MVYCVTFDRTGNYVLTGADDNLVKVWDVHQGLLRYTYRGHSAEVADVTVSYCNQMIASGSVDKSIRSGCQADQYLMCSKPSVLFGWCCM
ncbi:hypothetical protein ANCDUO_11283 [Ancylostoma duodenale]|uniref:Uncharacterized protein n=1 Tax=Ancylostoma duodenale TaxID=51022 RepID=A0A0C2GNE8_9BILA|nr:hypothetical protein ANCDUO_11283 [Ancylostoma duodenale]